MSSSKKPIKDISQLLGELEVIVQWFESDAVDVAVAVKKYELGLDVVKQLEKLLGEAKLQVEHIDKSFEK